MVGCERLCKTERGMCQRGQERCFGDTPHALRAGFLQLPVLALACSCSQRGRWGQNWTNTEYFPASQLGHPLPAPLQQRPGSRSLRDGCPGYWDAQHHPGALCRLLKQIYIHIYTYIGFRSLHAYTRMQTHTCICSVTVPSAAPGSSAALCCTPVLRGEDLSVGV